MFLKQSEMWIERLVGEQQDHTESRNGVCVEQGASREAPSFPAIVSDPSFLAGKLISEIILDYKKVGGEFIETIVNVTPNIGLCETTA